MSVEWIMIGLMGMCWGACLPAARRLLASGAIALLLAACGGGGHGGSSTPTAPSITAQPQNLTVVAGATATFSVAGVETCDSLKTGMNGSFTAAFRTAAMRTDTTGGVIELIHRFYDPLIERGAPRGDIRAMALAEAA